MSDQMFVITGGGTGAKVAESLVHLCATGMAPSHVHILLIDADASNGNVQRTVRAAQAYEKLQQYAWSVETNAKESSWNVLSSGKSVGTKLFNTNVHLYRLTKPLSTVLDGGLDTASKNNEDISQVLDLLYDSEERSATCEDGFRARPNLGCLLLSEHLNKELVQDQDAQKFLTALSSAVSNSTDPVPVVSTASVFGGTGASLLPVIRGCVENALKKGNGKIVDPDGMHWSAVKMLPHYEPAHREKSVDPDRFLLDTASALQFYSQVYRTSEDDVYNSVYLVGADRPSRNRVKVELGSSAQSNPPYFEEFVAGLAILDAADHASNQQAQQIRLFVSDENQQYLQWKDLPLRDSPQLRDRFAYLLHLAAFHLRQGGREELTKGLAQLLEETTPDHLRQFAWYKNFIDPWAKHHPAYESAGRNERPSMIKGDAALGDLTYDAMQQDVADYFGRLLLWAETALKGEHLALVDYADSDYVAIHQGMNALKKGDVDTVRTNGTVSQVQPEEDNALIRTLRAALTTMVRVHNSDIRLKVPVEAFSLVDGDGRIPLSISRAHVEQALNAHRLQGVSDSFTRTAMPASA